jgi:cyanophycin synthetase
VLAAPGDRRDEDIRDIAEIAAGHFDHYICRRDDNTRGRDGDEVPTMLKDKLLEKDIHIDAIEVIPDEQEATRRALEMADTGDLVLILGDNVKRTWKQIIYFNSGAHADDAAAKTPVTIDLPETDDFTFDSDIEIISDERGVRIAREEAD